MSLPATDRRISCSDALPLLAAFADGELVDGEAEAVAEHLDACASCMAEVEHAVAFRAALREKVRPSLPAAPARLRGRIALGLAAERASDNARRYLAAFGIAAACAAVVSFVIVRGRNDGGRPGALVQDAVEQHARQLPIEVAGQDVEPWFRGKVDFHVSVPRFRSANAPRIVGARLANVRERQAAYVVYDRGVPERRMTLLVYPGDAAELRGVATRTASVNGHDVMLANERGYNVAVWSRRGVSYSLVSDLDERDVLDLVGEVEER